MNDELRFNRARMWTFEGREYSDELSKVSAGSGPAKSIRTQKYRTFGVVAASFDDAFAAVRARHPHFRIENVRNSSAQIDYMADDPRALELAERLTK